MTATLLSPNSLSVFLSSLPKHFTQAKRTKISSYENLEDSLNAKHIDIGNLIGDTLASELFHRWDNHQDLKKIQDYLSKTRIQTRVPETILQNLVDCYGAQALSLLQNTPYMLLDFMDWADVDAIAFLIFQETQKSEQHRQTQRLEAALKTSLHIRLEDGHTWSSLETLSDLTRKFLQPTSAHLKITENIQEALTSLQDQNQIVFHKDGYQTGGCWQMEQDILDITQTLSHQSLIDQKILPNLIHQTNTYFETQTGYALGDTQKESLSLLQNKFGMISGYAGTGKTTALRALCHALTTTGHTIHVLALSARAAKRAGDAADQLGQTIAGFLVKLSLGKIHLDEKTVIIIDEASMLDLTSLWKIARRLNGAGLFLIGDPAQLPPIGFGQTLHALIENSNLPSVHLKHIYRQTEATGIPSVANIIRQGQVPDIPFWTPDSTGVSFLPSDPTNLLDNIRRIGSALKAKGVAPDDIQILSPIKSSPTGTKHINAILHKMKHDHIQSKKLPGRQDIAIGDPVVWTKNDWNNNLLNGTLGRVIDIQGSKTIVDFEGVHHQLSIKQTYNLELAYALSVHKSQGSQWHSIIIPIFPSRILTKNLLYTAITRSSNNFIFVGNHIKTKNLTNQHSQTGYTQ
jgi:exodeoxyribonuclease V alpha subunit